MQLTPRRAPPFVPVPQRDKLRALGVRGLN
jgi:hypothetical protein